MASIASRLSANRVPVTDGRSAEARYLKRVRSELLAQCGAPSATERLLIDRIAVLSLRVYLTDTDPALADHDEYLALTRLLAELLVQLGVHAATTANMRRRPFCEAAA